MVTITPLTRYEERCRWPGCKREPVEMQIPLCDRHFEYIGIRFIDERSVFGSKFLAAVNREKADREAAERRRAFLEERQQALDGQIVVYYVRIGDHVKIGYTRNLKSRLTALRVDHEAVLATEPGGRALEAQRHEQFADERVGRRENFNPSRRLLAHIEKLRAKHGPPKITGYPKHRDPIS